MAMRFVDGFDHYTLAAHLNGKWTATSGATIGGAAPTPKTGVGRLAITGSGYASFTNPAGGLTGGSLACWFQPSAFAVGNPILSVLDGATVQLSFYLNGSGQVLIYRGTNAGTLLHTTAAGLTTTIWQHLRLDWLIDNAAGQAAVYLNGVALANLNTLDTQITANPTYDSFRVQAGAAGTHAFDDLVFCDSDTSNPLNAIGYVSTQPTVTTKLAVPGDGTHADFTPISGVDNGAMVDDVGPDDDTTMNTGTIPGEQETYNFQASGVTGTVHGVQVNLFLKGAGLTIAPLAYVGAVDFLGDDTTPTATYTDMRQVWQQAPTGAPWTAGTIDTSEFGVEVRP
jgi:hypothetical protein